MSYEYYHESIDDATLTYSGTEDTNYPATNLQDRNIRTFLKDSSPGGTSVNLVIDLLSARSCDYIILGNYLADADTSAQLTLQANSSDSWGAPTTVFSGQSIQSTSLTDYYKSFSSESFRYWRLIIGDSGATSLDNLMIGTIFLGTRFTHTHSPEFANVKESAEYEVAMNDAIGGARYGHINNTAIRRTWDHEYKAIGTSFKTNFETWRDSVYANRGLSLYPFYWSDDDGTTLYYVRSKGELKFGLDAYQAYNASINLVEEI